MKIANKEYTRKELLKKIGNQSQLGGTRHYSLSEGKSKGVKAVDFKNASGLEFTVLPDRGLDISLAAYQGINLVYLTPNGEVNPTYYDPAGFEWLYNFFAGLLTTCGLTYLGGPGKDGEKDLGLHGRYTNTPAKQVNDNSRWEGDEYILELTGVIEECSLFGDKIRMKRKITSVLGEKKLIINDTVENFGYKKSPFTILYHINPGFPLLAETSKLILTAESSEGVDENSKAAIDKMKEFTLPQAGFQEQNFLHKMAADKDGYAYTAMINPDLKDGLGLYLKFKVDTLPYLNEWKMMGAGDYVVGIEPCNTKCENRGILRKEKALPFLEAGEERNLEVEIGILEGKEEIDKFTDKVNKIINI